MFFIYFAFTSCIFHDLELLRRNNKITFTNQIESLSEKSDDESWYFVKFNLNDENRTNIIENIQKNGIFLNASNYVLKNVFNLFLSISQVEYILSNKYGEVYEIPSDNKITNPREEKWTFLTIECSDSLSIIDYYKNNLENECQYNFKKSTKSVFSVYGDKKCLTDLASILAKDKRIYAVTFDAEAKELNCRSTGFIQENSNAASVIVNTEDQSHIIKINKFLNEQGLNGTGVTVLVSDTNLDMNSAFFYDPNHPTIEYNKLMPEHRKVIYISANGTETVDDNEHGTHTSGSISGEAFENPISEYNGCAPGSKLAFYSSKIQGYNIELIRETMDSSSPQIASNSWGKDYVSPLNDNLWDNLARQKNNTLFIFAGGNYGDSFSDRESFQTITSPGSAKNVLTVGSIEPVSVDENSIDKDSKDVYITDSDGNSRYLKLLNWSNTDYDKNPGLKTLFERGSLKF